MVKLRALWPYAFNQELADSLRDMRPTVLDAYGRIDLEAARRIREANKMPGPVAIHVIEGDDVEELMRFWADWVAYAK